MEKSYTIVCPYCKNKQTAFIQTTEIVPTQHIECVVKTCKEIITGEMLENVIAETQFYTPGINNKF